MTAESISNESATFEHTHSSETCLNTFSSSSSLDDSSAPFEAGLDFDFPLEALDGLCPFYANTITSTSAFASPSSNPVSTSIISQTTHPSQPEQSAALNISPAHRRSPSPSLSDFLQLDDAASFSFPDDFHLAVPELDLLRAAVSVATRMRTLDRLWDIHAASIFTPSPASSNSSSTWDSSHSSASCSCNGDPDACTYDHVSSLDLALAPPRAPPSWTSTLPFNLRPTPAQLSTPHHAILDILPWPDVRTKLITAFSLLPTLLPKHPVDGTTVSVLRLVYDLEAGGCRVWGPDPTRESGWEVTQSFVDGWWWCLDRRILSVANEWRRGRGEGRLRFGGTKVDGVRQDCGLESNVDLETGGAHVGQEEV